MKRLRHPLALASLAAGLLLAGLWASSGRPVLCHYDALLWWFHLPATAGALLVSWLLLRHAGRPAGACVHCGYDLRGAPADTDRCPECAAEAVAADHPTRWPRIIAGVSLLGTMAALLLTGIYGFLLFGGCEGSTHGAPDGEAVARTWSPAPSASAMFAAGSVAEAPRETQPLRPCPQIAFASA